MALHPEKVFDMLWYCIETEVVLHQTDTVLHFANLLQAPLWNLIVCTLARHAVRLTAVDTEILYRQRIVNAQTHTHIIYIYTFTCIDTHSLMHTNDI